ncbi:MAG: hypothetical protein PHQ12_01180 [Chthoniobacteraceae bacterium]|nr:hypothetical protein [Chthoniobacteraceae bacterium]
MNFLKSPWTAAILAVLANLGITAWLIMSQQAALFANLPKVNIETPPLMWSFKDAEIEKFVAELRAERKKLDARELDLEKMRARLATEREELVKVQNDIQASRDQLTASIVEMQETEAANLKSLSTTYSTMAAPAVVNIFAEMDETMVVKILSLMKADKVGAIFQEMARPRTPDIGMAKRAALLSDKLRLLKARKDQP